MAKRDWKEIEQRVRRFLLEEWDPIGVKQCPRAANEYDSYVSGLLALLKRGATTADIAYRLHTIERTSMGLSGRDEGRLRQVAQKLWALVDD